MLLRFVNVGRWKRNGSLTPQRARCNGNPGALAGTLARRVVRTDGHCSGVCSPRGADAHSSPAQKAQEGSTQILLLRKFAGAAACDMRHVARPATWVRCDSHASSGGPKSSNPQMLTQGECVSDFWNTHDARLCLCTSAGLGELGDQRADLEREPGTWILREGQYWVCIAACAHHCDVLRTCVLVA